MTIDIDLSPLNSPAELVNAVFAARRGRRLDLLAELEALLDHEDPVVREEVLALLAITWQIADLRGKARHVLEEDCDPGVRARAALGVAALAHGENRLADADYLAAQYRHMGNPDEVRQACFEGLTRLAGRPAIVNLADTSETKVEKLLATIREMPIP